MHETHASIIIGREVTREADIGTVEHQKKKMKKEVSFEPATAQEPLNLKKGTQALQHIPKGSSEPKGSAAQDKSDESDWGSEGEVETLTSD
ncbi:hypothetical protein Tco_0544691, partial [Tanacetum coccineum]